VLGSAGFAVLRVATARQALAQARTAAPDLVLVNADLPDRSGTELCRALRDESAIGASTPVFVTSASALAREGRLAALRTGAWDVLTHPVDAEELLLRMGVYVRAKREADRARDEGLVDPRTGLYSMHGVVRRVRELGVEAARHRGALGCVVLAGSDAAASANPERVRADEQAMTRLLNEVGRRSDVAARLSRTEFAVVAPRTGRSGVLRLARRLLDAAPSLPRLRVGCCGADDFAAAGVDAVELLARATAALRHAQRGEGARGVCFFEPAGTAA
jgi:DNA-binding response OmpR family regulator